MLKAYDNVAMFSSNRENCLAACLNERRFVCRAAEFNSITFQCHLSDADRRSVPVEEFVDAPGIDYFENACLDGLNLSLSLVGMRSNIVLVI